MAFNKEEESSVLLSSVENAMAVGPAVKAAIRESRETWAVDLGAKVSYETWVLPLVDFRGVVAMVKV